MNRIELDVHTHTIASGHAYSTMDEMARSAADKGLSLFGITEHTSGVPGACHDLYFTNLKVVPRQLYGIEILLGAEINIIDGWGKLDLDERYMHYLDIRIAGIHKFCYHDGGIQKNTNAILGAIKNPHIDIISHPDDGDFPLDYEQIVKAAKQYHTLMEVNNNSLRNPKRKFVRENLIQMLELCKKCNQPVLLSSDAHIKYDVGNLEQAEDLLQQISFPKDLVINNSADAFKAYLAYNREKEKMGYT